MGREGNKNGDAGVSTEVERDTWGFPVLFPTF